MTETNLADLRIVITGGAGFLGQYVASELMSRDVPENQVLIPHIEDFDLTKEQDVRRMYAEMKPDLVIHLAAEVGGIGANRESPGRFFYANAAMGLHLIEHARTSKVAKFVQVGTVCAYPKFAPVPFQEDDLWKGYPEETNAPYGMAKKALLVMLQAYRDQYGLNGIYLLPVNLYGPGDNFDLQSSHVIPAMVRKFVDASRDRRPTVCLWGTGSASREFLFVADCARAIVMACARYDGRAPVNLGAGFEITIRDLTEKIRVLTGYQGTIEWDRSKPDGQPRRRLDVRRAKEFFGFEAEVGFDDGLRRTIEWYRQMSQRTSRETSL